jgi:transcriptional regulator with XRE-family HTH domain
MITTEIDKYLGRRLRDRRTERGLSQASLAASLDITPQQLSKLELGINALRASQIYKAAMALLVHPGWFYEGLPGVGGGR